MRPPLTLPTLQHIYPIPIQNLNIVFTHMYECYLLFTLLHVQLIIVLLGLLNLWGETPHQRRTAVFIVAPASSPPSSVASSIVDENSTLAKYLFYFSRWAHECMWRGVLIHHCTIEWFVFMFCAQLKKLFY